MKKRFLLATLMVVSSLPTLSWANNVPSLQESHSESPPSFFDFWDYDITTEAGLEKTLFENDPLTLSDPTLIANFGLEVKGAFPIAPTLSKANLLLGTDIGWSAKHFTIKDTYVGIGFALGQLKYGLLSTLPENPLANYWKGEGANNIAIYNHFDTLLKNAYRFESIPLKGFSFHVMRGTSGYVTGATNKPDINFTISDIPVTGYGLQFQDKGLTVRYTAFTKKGDARPTVAPRGTYDLPDLSPLSSSGNGGGSGMPSSIPVYGEFRESEQLPSSSTSLQCSEHAISYRQSPSSSIQSSTGISKDTYTQRQIEVSYDQHPLWWHVGYQQKQSREGWGNVSSVIPVIPSQKAIETIKEDIGLVNEILQNPDVKFTWPLFKTHEFLAGMGYAFGQFRPKAMVIFGTIDKSSRRNIGIDLSQCNTVICQSARSIYGESSSAIEREIPMSDYRQYILGMDYLVNAHTTLGISYGKIHWNNHDYGSDKTLKELGAWQDKRSFGLHISHRF